MSCKTYEEVEKDLDGYLASDDDLNTAFKRAREAEYADLADAYVASRAWVVDTLNSAVPYYNRQRVEILNIENLSDRKRISFRYPSSTKVYTTYAGEYSPFYIRKRRCNIRSYC